MPNWEPKLLKALERSQSPEQKFQAIALAAADLGFRWCAYGCEQPLPFTNRRIFLISNYASSWRERYAEAGYLKIDPTVLHARRSLDPVLWSNTIFRPTAQLWHEARGQGMRYGWSQSCFGPGGTIGLLSLARDAESLGRSELLTKQSRLRLLVNVAHASLAPLAPGGHAAQLSPLTPQEVQVLQWSADGKSSDETAELMGLSMHTVEFHVKNAVRKLCAGTRAAATARAAVTGSLR